LEDSLDAHQKSGTAIARIDIVRNAKNGKSAQQFIDRELGEALRCHVASKAPAAKLFRMPDRHKLAKMLRADLTVARDLWLAEASGDAAEFTKRKQSDFLAEKNEAGEWLDFHSLRHTTGSWLAISGADTKLVQTVMRHSTPVLTMNRYGHLLPGAEANAADRLGAMISPQSTPDEGRENILPMTGTDDAPISDKPEKRAQRLAQRARRETPRQHAKSRGGDRRPLS
jgi:hypothetical protein